MEKNEINLSINIEDSRWNNAFEDFQAYSFDVVTTCFKVCKKSINPNMELNIILVDDNYIQKINKDYRGKDKPTNVISFETGDKFLLGDIFISYDTLTCEAMGQNISFKDHYTHLLCHGVLHILGFDHINDEDAEIMENLEIKILRKFKIENPYK